MKIRIFYSNDMIKKDESSRLLIRSLRICGAPDDIKIVRPVHGKPYAENIPWLSFSVTHTGNTWICAAVQPMLRELHASAAFPPAVGIDAEYADRRILHPEKISEKYFSEKEKQYLQEVAAASGRAHLFDRTHPKHTPTPAIDKTKIDKTSFIKTWTMKEAYLKMLGTGITDEARKSCIFSDTAVYFLTGEPLAQLEKELSSDTGHQLIISLCFNNENASSLQENTTPELEILRLY